MGKWQLCLTVAIMEGSEFFEANKGDVRDWSKK